MPEPPFSCKTNTQEGQGEVRTHPPQQQMLHPGHGEMPLPAATATFTDGISNPKTHPQHFILIAPQPISNLSNRMSFYLHLHTAPDSRALAGQPCSARCWPKGTFIICSHSFWVLHRESSDLSPWSWSLDWQLTPPHLQFFLLWLISVLFLARDKKSLVPPTDLCQARLILKVQVEAFLRLWDHPSGATVTEDISAKRKEFFKFHQSISPGKRESLSHHSSCTPFLQYPTNKAGSQHLRWAGLEQGWWRWRRHKYCSDGTHLPPV